LWWWRCGVGDGGRKLTCGGERQGAAGAADAPAAEANGGGKGKKAKTAPPSPAMQALLRGKREREKALKRHQRSDRAAFLKALGELERDALEQTLPDLMQWAEAGAG